MKKGNPNLNMSGLVPGGHVYKYKGADTCREYVELAAKGKTDAQIAGTLGVTCQSFRLWEKKYPEFAQARAEAKDLSEKWWTDYCQAKATGQVEGDFQAARWVMMNKFGWRDKGQQDVTVERANVIVEFVNANQDEQDEKQ